MRARTAHDPALAAIAVRQYGLVSREQLGDLGVDRGEIERRVATARLHRVHRGVFAVGHVAPRAEAR